MVNMQKGDLILLFAQHKENGIQKIDYFDGKVKIASTGNENCIWFIGKVHWLTQ
jgi:hypothetical protein